MTPTLDLLKQIDDSLAKEYASAEGNVQSHILNEWMQTTENLIEATAQQQKKDEF